MRRIAAVEFRPHRVVPKYWWTVGIGSFTIALLALITGPASRDAAAQAQCPFTIDFAGLPAGTILGEQYAAQGVHISGVARDNPDNPQETFPDALIVFDTNDAQQSHDPDLHINIGNIAIFALNVTDSNADGLVDDPDENNFGGTSTLAFDHEVRIGSVKWIDKDHVKDNLVIAYNPAGEVIVSVPVPLGANGSVQTIAINADGVRRLVFDYQESGGFTGIEVDCEQSTPTPTAAATPTPTAAPTATPSPAPEIPTATPEGGTSTQAPPAPSPSPSPTVAAAVSPPEAGTSVAGGPGALPAGGGSPPATEGFLWTAPLVILALVLGGTFVSKRRGSG